MLHCNNTAHYFRLTFCLLKPGSPEVARELGSRQVDQLDAGAAPGPGVLDVHATWRDVRVDGVVELGAKQERRLACNIQSLDENGDVCCR